MLFPDYLTTRVDSCCQVVGKQHHSSRTRKKETSTYLIATQRHYLSVCLERQEEVKGGEHVADSLVSSIPTPVTTINIPLPD